MIPKIHKQGAQTIGLLHYLYGPGSSEEHVDPHMVAAFDPLAPDPGRDPQATLKQLQQLLDQAVLALPRSRRPAEHVWHLSVRAAPDDPILSDEQWATIATRMVSATGIAPEGDEAACRWVAVRHADDHIHIVATLVRDDGRRPRRHNEARRAQAEARRIEADYDLHRVTPGDGTAVKRPTSAERHKAERKGLQRTAREELHEAVRQAVAGAGSEAEFFERLHAAGLIVRQRLAPSGDLLGYKVALPGDHNGDSEPVFYAGSTLAADLSLPRIRKRFADAPNAPDAELKQFMRHVAVGSRDPESAAAAARRSATAAAWAELPVLDQDGDGAAAARIAATGEILDALALTSAVDTRQQLREAARAFERACRSHTREQYRHAQALRRAARGLVHAGPVTGRNGDGTTTAMLLDTLFLLALAAAHWHAQRKHTQQAEAARRSAAHIHAAYRSAAAPTLAHLQQRGQQLSPAVRRWHATHVQAVLPDLTDRILSEPGWPALATTLVQAHQDGHDPRTLLAEAVAHRELDSADSVSEVLVWRIRHLTDRVWVTDATGQRRTSASRIPTAQTTPPVRSAPSPGSRR